MKMKLLPLLLFVFFNSCNFQIDKGPRVIDVAKDISRSKELGLFIDEFTPKKITINDTLEFEIVSAWTEYNFYTFDIEDKYQKKYNWSEGKQWKLKQDFNPENRAHLSFLVKGNFKKRFKDYGDHWRLVYCQLIETNDTAISNNYTYFETYGSEGYDSLTNTIFIKFEYYISSRDTNKYGFWRKFGEFNLEKKSKLDTIITMR